MRILGTGSWLADSFCSRNGEESSPVEVGWLVVLRVCSMGVNGDKEDGNPMEYAIWKQVIDQTFVPRQPLEMEDTVVTPYVWNLFSRMDMARCLWCQRPTAEVLRLCGEKGIRLDVSCEPSRGRKKNKSKTSERASRSSNCDSKLVTHHEDLIKSIRVGDVVAVEKEAGIWADSQNVWRPVLTSRAMDKHNKLI